MQAALEPFIRELGEVREELGREKALREQAEKRTADLEAELEAIREARESPETVDEAPEGAEPRPDAPGPQEGVRRPWWRRVLGGS